jgi:predicted MFS family arabinose efflux permease
MVLFHLAIIDRFVKPLSQRRKWVVLLAAMLAFIAYAFAFQAIPPLMTSIVEEFHVTNAEAGLLMSVVLLPGILLSIPVSVAVDRFGVRLLGVAALLFIVLSSIVTAVATTYTILLVGRILLGFSASLILIVAPSIVPQWFSREELGRAMGLFTVAMPLATIVVFPAASAFAVGVGWRYTFYVSTALGVASTVAYALVVKDGPLSRRGEVPMSFDGFRSVEVWKIGIVWLFFTGSMMSFNTWAPTLLSSFRGFTPVEASFYASLLSWISLFIVPVYGVLSDRLGRRKVFIVVGALLLCLVEVAMAYSSSFILVALIVALGVVSAMVPGNIQTLPSEVLGAGRASVGFAVLGICSNVGIAATQPLPGIIIDSTGSYSLALLSMAGFAAACCVSSLLLRVK